jgi:HAD superfamily hydrolase (TIGR01509 family)
LGLQVANNVQTLNQRPPLRQPRPQARDRFDAIIFDMDGVIVDSEPRHQRAFCEVFEEMGYGHNHGIDFAAYIGRSDRALWTDFVAQHRPPQPLEELLGWKQRRLIELLRQERPIFKGLPEFVAKLAARYRLALASGSNHAVIDTVLAMDELRRFFPVVSSVQDVGKPKPYPDIFLHAARQLGVAPDRCCVIEDSRPGIAAALAAGMEVVAITNSHPADTLAEAHRVVDSYEELEQLLLER